MTNPRPVPETDDPPLTDWDRSVLRQIRILTEQDAFGSVQVFVERGQVVRIKLERSIKEPRESQR